MKLTKTRSLGLILSLLVLVIYSCSKYYINHNFRQNYSNANEIIQRDSIQVPFFKIHFKNGDVSIIENWYLNKNNDSLIGEGKLYNFNRNQIREGDLSFSIDDIAIVETNQLEAIKSKDKDRIAALSILTGANVILDIVCITNPKACFGSCPTFYLEGDSNIHLARAEGFSSSIAPSLERQDIDALKKSTSAKEFFITMKNEAFETHMINELLLYAVPKSDKENIYQDKNNTFYNCGELYNSKIAKVGDKEIGHTLNKIDEIEYFSFTDANELAAKEALILEFDKVSDQNLGVVINFRQTLLTTYLLYTGISYMGNEVGDYFAKIETNKQIKKKLENPFKRLGKIELSVWNYELKKWILFDQLYETGPIAKNLMIAPIPDMKQKNETVKIKVEMSKGLWRLDYLGLTNINSIVKPLVISPATLNVINGENYTVEEIKFDDHKYLISFPGNEYQFKFELPEVKNSDEYELFLSSKGYYLEWIRQDWIREKNLSKLKKMLLNDANTWLELAQEFKSMEHDMETVFWNSKYSNIN